MTRRQKERLERFGQPRAQVPAEPSAVAVASNSPAPIQAPPIVEEKPNRIIIRTASVSMVMPMAVYNGRLQNPDTVLKQFGGSMGVAYYRLLQQENLGLSADCGQAEDRVNAIDRVIKPGDPSVQMSIDMANDCRRIFKRLSGVSIINLWIYRCRWYGVTSIGKAGWRKDEGTGLMAPFDLYNIDPWRWRFGPNFEPYLLTQRNQYFGEPIPKRSVFFTRWGSLFTAYGESDLRDVYLSCWYMQNVQKMLLHSIEVLGRPIPWIEVGGELDGTEFDDFERGISAQYGGYYVITRTPGAKTSTTFPNMGALANGTAGKSEQDFMRYHGGQIQRKILGTQQTQDKTGGSRALEDSRLAVAKDKTPPGSQIIDTAWTNGWLDDISLVNWPNQPREYWPVMDSDASDIDEEPLTGGQMDAIGRLADQIRLKQVTPEWAIEMLVKSKIRRARAAKMVASMTDPKAGLSLEPPQPSPAARQEDSAA